MDEAGSCQKEGDLDWLETLAKSQDEGQRARAYSIQRAEDAREKIRFRCGADDIENGVKLWSGRTTDECAALERDFTTSGTPGKLGCPFSSTPRGGRRGSSTGMRIGHSTPRSSISRSSAGKRSKRASFHDPIKVDLGGNRPVTADGSIEGSVPLCPIRFLDQHSPEEVAQYFEKHKHELPRSHEFCVKRFQENEEALHNLDSKYVNMVAMVKDLGKMHQPLLPEPEEIAVDGDHEVPQNTTSNVERWANDVLPSHHGEEDELPNDENDERVQRFDRSLKDIRVGESPSRPWGIHVPERFEPEGDVASKQSDPTASPLEPATAVDEMPPGHPPVSDGHCPFSALAGASKRVDPIEPATEQDSLSVKATRDDQDTNRNTYDDKGPHFFPGAAANNQAPGLVFNGPVFFGYSAEKTALIMQALGSKC